MENAPLAILISNCSVEIRLFKAKSSLHTHTHTHTHTQRRKDRSSEVDFLWRNICQH